MADASSAAPVCESVAVANDNDGSEWEYEYSTTETETHLITLDLSLPEFVRRREEFVVHKTRGGFRPWLNPINLDDAQPNKLEKSQAGKTTSGGGTKPKADSSSRKGDDEEDVEEDNSDNVDNVENVDNDNDNDNEEPDPTEIQILDLHAPEPIIAYRGMLFKGAWRENIGTEMLFADPPAAADTNTGQPATPAFCPSPIHLGAVDLVGAASARIACSPVELRDRGATERAEAMKKVRKRLGFSIPVANGATAQRQKQAAFLETLMAMKHRRGEQDVVTVQALNTKDNAVHDDEIEERRRKRMVEQSTVFRRRRRGQHLGEDEVEGEGEGEGAGAGDEDTTPVKRTSTKGIKKAKSQLERVVGRDNTANDEGEGSRGA